MLFLYIVAFILLAGFIAWQAPKGLTPAKRKAQIEYNSMSWPAKQIKNMFDAIPAANRPYDNITYILKALDVKYDVSEVNRHFMTEEFKRSSSYPYRQRVDVPSWSHHCYGTCKFNEYKQLRSALVDITEALEAQRRALEVAGVSDGLAQAEHMIESLRRERDLINEVTKELA